MAANRTTQARVSLIVEASDEKHPSVEATE